MKLEGRWLTKALAKMAESARYRQLKTASENHLRETEQHVARVAIGDRGSASLGASPVVSSGRLMIDLIRGDVPGTNCTTWVV